MKKGGSFVAFLTGMVVGAVTAVLLVPESGEETRRRLRETGLRRLRELEEEVRRLREEIQAKLRELQAAKGGEGTEAMGDEVETEEYGTESGDGPGGETEQETGA